MMKYTSTTKGGCGQHGIINYPIFARIQEDVHTKKLKRGKKWTGWKPKTEERSLTFKKMMEKNDGTEDCLANIQKNTENAARKVAHHAKQRERKK